MSAELQASSWIGARCVWAADSRTPVCDGRAQIPRPRFSWKLDAAFDYQRNENTR